MAGFFGKLPCRGDFLRSGLPGSFVSAWDRWLSNVLAFSREQMGDAWRDAWLEAPVWRFLLPAGQCGPDGVLGLWLPSVDASGRYFPLTVAAVFQGERAVRDENWLLGAEDTARAALEDDRTPAALQAALDGLGEPGGAPGGDTGVWWTEGAPRVAAKTLDAAAMPTPEEFVRMLEDAA